MAFEPDRAESMHGRCVVLVGNMSEGYEAVGPFDTFDDAASWYAGVVDCWIMTLHTPEEYRANQESDDSIPQSAVYCLACGEIIVGPYCSECGHFGDCSFCGACQHCPFCGNDRHDGSCGKQDDKEAAPEGGATS